MNRLEVGCTETGCAVSVQKSLEDPDEGRRSSHRKPGRIGYGVLFSLLLTFSFSSEAWSVPVSYSVSSGSVTLSVFVGGALLGSSTSPLTDGSFTTDSSAQSLNDISITLEPDIVLNLSAAYGGYDTVTIESATLSSSPGFFSTVIGSAGSSYTVLAAPLGVTGSWGGSNSGGSPPPVTNQPISYSVPSMTAVIGSAPLIYVNAVTLNSLDGSAFGEVNDLVVMASINVDSAVVIPEPTSALLLGLGLLGLGMRKRTR